METPKLPLGLTWTVEEAEKAASKKSFIRVSDSDKKSLRHLSGAERVWNSGGEHEIYLVEYRISGLAPDVEKALLSAGYDEETVKTAIESSINVKNYQTTKKEVYDSELRA